MAVKTRTRIATVLSCILCVAAAGCSTSDEPRLSTAPVMAYNQIRFDGIVRQVFDFSCGAASMATLLNGVYGESYKEVELLDRVRAQYDDAGWAVKRDEGLSLSDLVFLANSAGYEAQGAKISLAQLLKVKAPVIVHLNKGKFLHFSVFRGVKDGTVLMADPITGRTRYSPREFAEQYTGYALAVWKKDEPIPEDYALFTGAEDWSMGGRHAKSLGLDPFRAIAKLF